MFNIDKTHNCNNLIRKYQDYPTVLELLFMQLILLTPQSRRMKLIKTLF